MKNIIITLFVLISCNYFSQETINVNINNKEEVVKTMISFDKEWKFLCILYQDDSNKDILSGSIYNPILDSNDVSSRKKQTHFVRTTALTAQNLEDYLNGKLIYPLDDCKFRHDWGSEDYYYIGKKMSQNWCAKVHQMQINSNLGDLINQEGHIIYYDENGKFVSTNYIKYFDDNKNYVNIKLEITPEDYHDWNYDFFNLNDQGEYDKLFSAYINRSYCFFYFYNPKKQKMLYYLIEPDYMKIKEKYNIKNNAVYEMGGELGSQKITQDNKYDFFKQFFEDYPDFSFRLLYENLDKIYYNKDVKGGVNSLVIQEITKQKNFNYAIDLSIYEYIIKSYTNNKYEAFSLKQRNRIKCEGD